MPGSSGSPLRSRPSRLRRISCFTFSRTWPDERRDRKSTRLNSSHQIISYAVFCLKKKKKSLNNNNNNMRYERYSMLPQKNYEIAREHIFTISHLRCLVNLSTAVRVHGCENMSREP